MRSGACSLSAGSPTRQGRYSAGSSHCGGMSGSLVRGSVRSSFGAMDAWGITGAAGAAQQHEQQGLSLAVAVQLLKALTALASETR